MQTCDPLDARQRLDKQPRENWEIALVFFIPLLFALQIWIHPFLADVILIGAVFYLFFYILDKRAIAIKCPSCEKAIVTNMPWKCGNPNCQKINEQVDKFPIFGSCQHCGVETKAFKCPHDRCGKPIYLSEDKLKTIYATFISTPEHAKPRPAKKDLVAEKIAKQQQEKRDLEHEVEMTRKKGDLLEAKSKIEPSPKKKTPYEELEEYMQSIDGNEDAERTWRAAIDKKFKNDPDARKRKHLIVDQWMRNRLR